MTGSRDGGGPPRDLQLRERYRLSLCSTRRTQAWDRKVIRIGTDVSMWQQQGQEAAGEQARPHQGSSERLGHLGSLRRKSSEHRGALDFP